MYSLNLVIQYNSLRQAFKMIIVGAGHDNGVNDPLVLAASILATAINGAQRQQQQVSQVKIFYTFKLAKHI